MESQCQGWQTGVCRHIVPWLCLLICLLTAPPASAGPVVTLTDRNDDISLGEYLEVLEDKDKALTLPEVQGASLAPLFRANNSTMFRRGLSSSAWWLRFSLQNHDDQPRRLVLELDRASLGLISLHAPDSNGIYRQRDAGIRTPHVIADEEGNTYRFTLDSPAGSLTTYYLRLETNRGLTTNIRLLTPEAMIERQRMTTGLLGLGTGILLALCLYTAFLLHTRGRDRTSLWFSLYLLMAAVYVLADSGIIGVELFRTPNLQNFVEICSIFLIQVAATLLAGSFLQHFLSAGFARLMQAQALALGMLVTLVITFLLWDRLAEATAQRFDSEVEKVVDQISRRMEAHENILRAAAGLMQASDEVTRADWYNYVNQLGLERNFPGVLGVGLSLRTVPTPVSTAQARARHA